MVLDLTNNSFVTTELKGTSLYKVRLDVDISGGRMKLDFYVQNADGSPATPTKLSRLDMDYALIPAIVATKIFGNKPDQFADDMQATWRAMSQSNGVNVRMNFDLEVRSETYAKGAVGDFLASFNFEQDPNIRISQNNSPNTRVDDFGIQRLMESAKKPVKIDAQKAAKHLAVNLKNILDGIKTRGDQDITIEQIEECAQVAIATSIKEIDTQKKLVTVSPDEVTIALELEIQSVISPLEKADMPDIKPAAMQELIAFAKGQMSDGPK